MLNAVLGDITALLQLIYGYFVFVWVDAISLLGAATSVLISNKKRAQAGLPGLSREQAWTVCFSGASIVLLSLIALSAFSNTLMEYMLRSERFTLVIALLFAAYDECMRIATRWKANP